MSLRSEILALCAEWYEKARYTGDSTRAGLMREMAEKVRHLAIHYPTDVVQRHEDFVGGADWYWQDQGHPLGMPSLERGRANAEADRRFGSVVGHPETREAERRAFIRGYNEGWSAGSTDGSGGEAIALAECPDAKEGT